MTGSEAEIGDRVPPSGRAGLPEAAQVLARAGFGGIVVVGAAPDEEWPERVTAVLTGGYGVGAVVPGGFGPDLATARGAQSDSLARRDVEVAPDGVVAVAPGGLAGLRIDPDLDDRTGVAQAVVDHVRAQGLRVLADPQWSRPGAVLRCQPTAGAVGAAGSEVLVVTGFLSDSVAQVDDRLVFDLVRSMSEQVIDGSITVLLTDGFRSERQVARLRANGVNVVVPPLDADRWLRARLGRFSHVILTPSGLHSGIWERLRSTQPQAAKILFLSSLPFREVSALGPLTPPAEQPSLESVRAAVEARTVEMAAQSDAVWCDADADARWARGVLPGVPVHVVASHFERCVDPIPLWDRRGVLVIGDLGHDMVRANEDAAAAALQHLVPLLRDRSPDLPVTVIADMPSPFLRHAVAVHGARFVGGHDARAEAGRSRLIIDFHTYGTGGEASLRLAFETATPFVAHPVAAGGLELGPLAGASLFGAPADLSFRCRALLEDDQRWYSVQGLINDLVSQRYNYHRRAVGLREALAGAGIGTSMPTLRWIDHPGTKDARSPHRRVVVPLRPVGTPTPPPLEDHVPDDDDTRYRLWANRYGATGAVLDALQAEVAGLAYQPMISVLVPVYDTAAAVLTECIESVRAQIYARWQLCLADDGSTRPETLATLDGLEPDPRVKVVRLAANAGISAATNVALGAADGDYVAFLDHDDVLQPHALAQVVRWLNADPSLDVVYTDEDKLDENGDLVQPHIKPDWSPNMIMARNYVSHLTVIRRSLVDELGGLRSGFDGSQDHDLILRVMEHTDRIAHIPEPLYSWRIIPGSAAADIDAKPYAALAAKRALSETADRRGHPVSIGDGIVAGTYRTQYRLFGRPRVAIIIPTRDGLHLLEPCVRSIAEKSTYDNYEIVVVDNQTTDGPTLAYLARFPGRVVRYDHPFNYARMMNAAARATDCDVLLFLNNDTEVITPSWIEEMLEHAMRREVGAVGPRLYCPDGRVQHEGIVIGQGVWAGNVDHGGYWGRGQMVRDTSAVTGACTMMRSSVYWRIGGNDERLRVAYNDVDLSLRVHQAGYDVVFTPYAELYHFEGASRAGREHHEDGPQFGIRWRPSEGVDPYHSPIFDRTALRFRIQL
jgi:GT2 family glycosyltransferase